MDFPYDEDWVIDDQSLEISWNLQIDSVPTLLSFTEGEENSRTTGWDRNRWREFTGLSMLGENLPEFKPG